MVSDIMQLLVGELRCFIGSGRWPVRLSAWLIVISMTFQMNELMLI